MIAARARQDWTKRLIIFHNDSLTVATDIRDLVAHLAMDATALSFIIIGLDASIFPPGKIPDLVIEELKNFSYEEIALGLSEAFEELNISPSNVSKYLESFLSSVEPGNEYNKRVSAAARRALEGLSYTVQA